MSLAVRLEVIRARREYLVLPTEMGVVSFSFAFNLVFSQYDSTVKPANGIVSSTTKSIEPSNSQKRIGGRQGGGRITMLELTRTTWSYMNGCSS
jgi:hypothetical protein